MSGEVFAKKLFLTFSRVVVFKLVTVNVALILSPNDHKRRLTENTREQSWIV